MSVHPSTESQLQNYHTIKSWLRHFAFVAWERIEFARKDERNKIFKITLTQNMVFEFLRLQKDGILPIEIEKSKNERVSGTDSLLPLVQFFLVV